MVAAARQLGISRSRLYELWHRYERYGEVGCSPSPVQRAGIPGRCRRRCGTPSWPTRWSTRPRGPAPSLLDSACPVAGGLGGVRASVYNVLRAVGLGRVRARLAAAEELAAAEGGPLTERALRDLRAIQATHRHVGSDIPGEQVFFDTMYIGNLKGVGKLWQYSAVDGATSFAMARVLAGEKSAPRSATASTRPPTMLCSESCASGS